ncbi:MAG: phosphoribosylglycinamide formyltransferase [Alphaproteobacteria bacterium]|nr:MAG: phosphoribosylglycinamide formyltransferase [Alphaproteobacteria bacterium]
MSPTRRLPIGVMISGRGSNLQALIDACAEPAYPARIALVVSNVAAARGLERARAAGIATRILPHRDFATRAAFDAAVTAAFEDAGVEIICMAGFMRLVTPEFVARWHDRLLNIHPSLLPAFRGLDTHARALAAGVKVHGCTVHLVRSELDTGPILGQAAVPVLPADTPERLAARVLAAEHRLYPHCLRLFIEGRIRVAGEVVEIDSDVETVPTDRCLINPPLPKP